MSEQSTDAGGTQGIPATGVDDDSDVAAEGLDDARADELAGGVPASDGDDNDHPVVNLNPEAAADAQNDVDTDDGEYVGSADADADRQRAMPDDAE